MLFCGISLEFIFSYKVWQASCRILLTWVLATLPIKNLSLWIHIQNSELLKSHIISTSSNNLPWAHLIIEEIWAFHCSKSSHCWRVGENVTAVILCSCNSAIFSVNEQLNTHDYRVLMLELVTSPILIIKQHVKHLSWQQIWNVMPTKNMHCSTGV